MLFHMRAFYWTTAQNPSGIFRLCRIHRHHLERALLSPQKSKARILRGPYSLSQEGASSSWSSPMLPKQEGCIRQKRWLLQRNSVRVNHTVIAAVLCARDGIQDTCSCRGLPGFGTCCHFICHQKENTAMLDSFYWMLHHLLGQKEHSSQREALKWCERVAVAKAGLPHCVQALWMWKCTWD